jgi:hypothetical protein
VCVRVCVCEWCVFVCECVGVWCVCVSVCVHARTRKKRAFIVQFDVSDSVPCEELL